MRCDVHQMCTSRGRFVSTPTLPVPPTTGAHPGTLSESSPSAWARSVPDGFQHQARGSFENAVVRYKRDAETERGGSDPTIGVVSALSQGVPGPRTRDPEFDIGTNEITTGVDNLGASDRRIQAVQGDVAPAAEHCAVSEFRHGLEREESRTAHEYGFVVFRHRRVGGEPGAVDVGVDDDRSAVPAEL